MRNLHLNIKLNFDKIQYKQKQVEFFGDMYTTQGCKPSDTKVEAITEMPKPENLKNLQTFLGMIQYLRKFLPWIAELAEPLRDLTKKNAHNMHGDLNITKILNTLKMK